MRRRHRPDRELTSDRRLKLRAEDADDLAIISACLQDAMFALGEMAFEPEDHRFAAILVRRRWDLGPDESVLPSLDCIKAGIHFDTVRAVKLRHIDQADRSRVLQLGAILSEPGRCRTVVRLMFLDGAEIWLEADRLACRFQDLEPAQPDEAAEGAS